MAEERLTRWQRWLHGFLFVVLPLVWWTDLPDPGLAPRLLLTAAVLLVVSFYCINYLSNDMLRSSAATGWVLFVCWSVVGSFSAIGLGDALFESGRRGVGLVLAVVAGGFLRLSPGGGVAVSRWASVAILLFASLFLFDALPAWFGSKATVNFPTVDFSFGATLGNKNFLAESILFLAFLLPAGWNDSILRWKSMTRIASLVAVLLMVWLQSVAVLAGFVFGATYYLIGKTGWSAAKRRAVLLALPLLALAVMLILPGAVGRIGTEYRRFTSPLSLQRIDSTANNSTYERLLMWRNSWLLIKEHPVSGVGVTDWRIEQAKGGVGGTVFLNTGLSRFEHPHNEYLLVTAEQGVIGLICLLLALGALFMPVRTKLSGIDTRASKAAVVAGMVAACFAYPFSGDVPWLYFMLHVGVVLAAVTVPQVPSGGNRMSAASVFLSLIVVGVLVGSFLRLRAEYHLGQGIAAQVKRKTDRSVEEYRQASSFTYTMDRTGTPVEWYLGNELFRSGDTARAILALEYAQGVNPYHARLANDLGSLYEKRGSVDQAIGCYRSALQYVPGMAEARLNLAATYYNAGNTAAAFSELKSIMDARALRGKERESFDRFSLVIARQLALEDSTFIATGVPQEAYLEKVWDDGTVRRCFGSCGSAAAFRDCMRLSARETAR